MSTDLITQYGVADWKTAKHFLDLGVRQSDTCTSELDAGIYRLLGQTYGRRKVMDIYKEGEPIHNVATV